ncbi:MAG: hypothetical protein JWN83_653 [Chitinophagaceae bacterium]|nr:hypothetical protein [Chitinophagaceae bacterium]
MFNFIHFNMETIQLKPLFHNEAERNGNLLDATQQYKKQNELVLAISFGLRPGFF